MTSPASDPALTDAAMSALADVTVSTARRRWLRRYLLPAMGGTAILAWLLVAALAPWITPYMPDTVNVTGRLAGPSLAHWLGTDELGRDVLTRIIYGARTSLTVGFTVVLVGGGVGTLVGALLPSRAAGPRKS
jgi:peptide/nickel transport system permease protein